MEPLEIRVPEEEWKAMPIDHTGKTVNDQVMVFRPSDAQPYGTVDVAGEKAPVVIPPEYISRYEFPKDWETEAKYGNKTLWGYRPTKKEIIVDDEGKLVAYKKAHGKRKAWSELIADMKDTMNEQTPEEEVAVIHSGTPEDAEQFRTKILETYPQLKKVTVNLLGPVITAHVGPGFMAVVYHGTNRK